ncbi:MAG: hypothetical protein P4M01_00500 [Acidobacteriota bacterium]|nr:hypothetical protein [Acidobacteriota bacterium]
MKRFAMLVLWTMLAATLVQAQAHWSFKGTVIKMSTHDCPMRGFVAAMSGGPVTSGTCQEYTILSDKVVYVVLARRGPVFMPLAENIDFVVTKNELTVLSDDEKSKSRFAIQQMTLRSEWEREEARKEMATRLLQRSLSSEPPANQRPILVQRAER